MPKSEEIETIDPDKEADLMAMPSVYCFVEYGWEWYDWQADCVDSLAPKYSCTSLRTCNGSGKTSMVVAGLILWHMKMFPGSLVIYTSASNRQIKGQLFPRIRPVVQRHHPEWKIRDGNEYSITDPETNSRTYCYATDDPGLAEGWHPQGKDGTFVVDGEEFAYEQRLLIIMDEMKSISPLIVDPLRIRCRHTNELDVSSPPLVPAGDFYDNFHSNKSYFDHGLNFPTQEIPGHNLFKASIFDCPHLKDNAELYKRMMMDRATKGASHPLILSSQDAEFPTSGERMVFNLANVDFCMNSLIPSYGTSKRIAIDLSGGHDEIVLGYRIGNHAYIYWTSHETFAPILIRELVKKCKELMSEFGIKKTEIFADSGGLGKAMIQMMEKEGLAGIRFFNFGDKPRDEKSYKNARSEMAFELADRIDNHEVILPKDDKLKEQFGWVTYEESDDKNTIKLTPKAKMLGSPDRVDVMKMLFYNMSRMQKHIEDLTVHNARLSPTGVGQGFNIVEESPEPAGLFF